MVGFGRDRRVPDDVMDLGNGFARWDEALGRDLLNLPRERFHRFQPMLQAGRPAPLGEVVDERSRDRRLHLPRLAHHPNGRHNRLGTIRSHKASPYTVNVHRRLPRFLSS
jgi:hypothetical protein